MDRASDASNPPETIILQFWSHHLSQFGHDTNLSPRELEIMGVMIREITQSEDIALELSISTHTVNNHLKNIFEKTKSRSKTDVLAKFYAYATRHILRTYDPDALMRPYRIQIISQDLSYAIRLGQKLRNKGVQVHTNSMFKQENYISGTQFDLVLKPMNFSKEMEFDDLLPLRKSHILCIQIEKNYQKQSDLASTEFLVKPELLSLGCIGTISQTETLEQTIEKISQSLRIFSPSTLHDLPDSQSKRIALGPIDLSTESLGTHGVFISLEELGKAKIQWQPGSIVDLRFHLPNFSPDPIDVVCIVVWRRFSPEIGRKAGIGLWFLNFPKNDDFFVYQSFVQKFKIHWAIPAATDQFEENVGHEKQVQLPAGA